MTTELDRLEEEQFDLEDDLGDEEELEDPEGTEEETEPETPERAARRQREIEEAKRHAAARWALTLAERASADPADAPAELYGDYLRQIQLAADYTSSINDYLFGLNTHCHCYQWGDGQRARFATYARLMREGILTLAGTGSLTFTINRAALPAETRDLYATALDYLSHDHLREQLNQHDLSYSMLIYRDEDRKQIWARLLEDSFINDKGVILRRPAGSTIEIHSYHGRRGEASIRLQRLPKGWSAYTECTVSTKANEGFGRSGPAYPPEHSYTAEEPIEVWPDRSSAFSAAGRAVAKQAEETLVEAELHRTWHPQVRDEARKIRHWVEMLNKGPIPQQLPDNFKAERAAFLSEVRRHHPHMQADEPEAETPSVETAQFALF